MLHLIIYNLKKLWESSNIQGFVILSFCMQIILVIFAPFRKRTSHMFVILSIWAAYLLADWIASFAVGLIANNQRSATGTKKDGEVFALWASILLLHIGGPDSITAFNLEDNELWRRQLFGLAAQIIAAGYIFSKTLPDNSLLIPTSLLFVAGIVKYVQRIRALRLASKDMFRHSALYAGMESFFSSIELHRTNFLLEYPELNMVRYAKRYHDTMKELLVDVPFNISIRDVSREFFLGQTPEVALQILAIELNLIYETFFTKMVVVHGFQGLIILSASFTLVTLALVWLYFMVEKQAMKNFDWGITYSLLIGSLILDSFSLFKIFFCDWTAADLEVKPMEKRNLRAKVLDAFYKRKKIQWRSCLPSKNEVLATPLLFRRWSESIPGFNQVAYCLKQRPPRIHKPRRFSGFAVEEVIRQQFDIFNDLLSKCFHPLTMIFDKEKYNSCFCFNYLSTIYNKAKDATCFNEAVQHLGPKQAMDKWRYSSNDPLKKELWSFIFYELRDKHPKILPQNAAKMYSARGELAIQKWDFSGTSPVKDSILDSITKVDYYQSILVWHLATDMCYYTQDDISNAVESTDDNDVVVEAPFSNNDCREFSKNISDYMLYLLILKPELMPSFSSAFAEINFNISCDELLFIIEGQDVEKACEQLFNTDLEGIAPIVFLHAACNLARKLKSVRNKWVLISRVWVEMLSYAATHCQASAHLQQLGWGGELVCFVWLLMAHLGFINPSILSQRDGEPFWEAPGNPSGLS